MLYKKQRNMPWKSQRSNFHQHRGKSAWFPVTKPQEAWTKPDTQWKPCRPHSGKWWTGHPCSPPHCNPPLGIWRWTLLWSCEGEFRKHWRVLQLLQQELHCQGPLMMHWAQPHSVSQLDWKRCRNWPIEFANPGLRWMASHLDNMF